MNERLRKLQEIGQSVWVDSLSRDDIQDGNLQRMMEDGVLGPCFSLVRVIFIAIDHDLVGYAG